MVLIGVQQVNALLVSMGASNTAVSLDAMRSSFKLNQVCPTFTKNDLNPYPTPFKSTVLTVPDGVRFIVTSMSHSNSGAYQSNQSWNCTIDILFNIYPFY